MSMLYPCTMKLNDVQEKVLKTIASQFPKERKTVRDKIAFATLALIKSKVCSIPEIAMQMGSMNGLPFHTNEMRINRLLQASTFQVSDSLWRSHIRIVFSLLAERGLLQQDGPIPINIDYTSSTDEFLILSASVPFAGRGIPLYFSMRCYPKRKNRMSLIKMETAFLKELQHLLPKTHTYVIVGDRGFGNVRIMKTCEELGFSYILRLSGLNVGHGGETEKITDMEESGDFAEVFLTAKKHKARLIVSVSPEQTPGAWHIATNLKAETAEAVINQYAGRFHIEKMFQDEKSSGFAIEKLKIKKYDRFKRMYYLVCLAQVLLMFIGDYINGNADDIKKKFPLHINLISVFSGSPDAASAVFAMK
jgi:hypothetical protein